MSTPMSEGVCVGRQEVQARMQGQVLVGDEDRVVSRVLVPLYGMENAGAHGGGQRCQCLYVPSVTNREGPLAEFI